MYTIRPIRSEEDYEAACARIRELMGAQLDTPEGDELDVLADLVEHYEDKHYPVGMPTAIDAIEFRIDQAGLTPPRPDPLDRQPAESFRHPHRQARYHHLDGPRAA